MGEGPAEIVASNVRRTLEETTMNSIIQFGLHQYMVQLQRNCNTISGKIAQRYFMGTLRHAAA
jgi:uncharacterized alpha-E superfamily protein